MKRDCNFLDTAPRGVWFSEKEYDHAPLYRFEEVKDRLPSPHVPAREDWVACYWYAVETLFGNTHRPTEESGFVRNFVDAAFNKDIFLWDTCFMTMFCSLFPDYVPGICSLDNFYCKQFDDGEIPREMVRDTGRDFLPWVNAYDKPLYSYFHKKYGFRKLGALQNLTWEDMYSPDLGRTPKQHPYLTLDNLNHPILAWAEWCSYLQSGDIGRLERVFEPLFHYYDAFHEQVRHVSGLYVTDWASMDNSPRNKALGMGIDPSCEMVLFARNLLDMMHELASAGRPVRDSGKRTAFLKETMEETADAIQRYMWNGEKGFFYDVDKDLRQIPIKTAAAFWTLVSGVADRKQQKILSDWLNDPATFNRIHRVPVLAADEPDYCPDGGYWRGSVWAPMNKMIVDGLERCGDTELARDIALNDLNALTRVFGDTGTIWENYPADSISKGSSDHPAMVGWSGMAPILFLVRYGIGLSADSRTQTVEWRLDPAMAGGTEIGLKRYVFFGKQADFMASRTETGIRIRIGTKDSFHLKLVCGAHSRLYDIKGDTVLAWPEEKGFDCADGTLSGSAKEMRDETDQ